MKKTSVKSHNKPLYKSESLWIKEIHDKLTEIEFSTWEDFFNILYQELLTNPNTQSEFFSRKYYNIFIYETMLDIYHVAKLSQERTFKKKYNLSKSCETFLEFIDPQASPESLRTQLYPKKNELIDAIDKLNVPINRIAISQKTLNYYMLMSQYLNEPYVQLDPCSFIYNLKHYPSFIYNESNYKSGIQYYNFTNSQKEFLDSHPNTNKVISFDNEYACYVNEKLHHSIQFQKGMHMFCSRKFAKDKIKENVRPLYTFTKLYDIDFLSLTKYMEDNYASSFSRLYESDNDSRNLIDGIFIEIQTYNSYILPLLSMLIKKIYFDKYEKNYETISKKATEYITSYLKQDSFGTSFYQTLKAELHQREKNTYPFDSAIKLTETLSNTNCIEANFNKLYSLYFFTKDFKKYIEIALQNPETISLENCQIFISHHYFSILENTPALSINDAISAKQLVGKFDTL